MDNGSLALCWLVTDRSPSQASVLENGPVWVDFERMLEMVGVEMKSLEVQMTGCLCMFDRLGLSDSGWSCYVTAAMMAVVRLFV